MKPCYTNKKKLVEAAVAQDYRAFEFASDELREDVEFVKVIL